MTKTKATKTAGDVSTGKLAPAPAALKGAPEFAIITSKPELNARITALAKSGAELQHEVHLLACSVLAHVAKHRNVMVLTNFLAAVPDMVRKNALQSWVEHFSQLEFSPIDKDSEPSWRINGTKKPLRLGDAMVKPFWKFKANEGMPYEPIDVSKFLESIISKLVKDAEKTGRNHDHIVTFLKTTPVSNDKKAMTLPPVAEGPTVGMNQPNAAPNSVSMQ